MRSVLLLLLRIAVVLCWRLRWSADAWGTTSGGSSGLVSTRRSKTTMNGLLPPPLWRQHHSKAQQSDLILHSSKSVVDNNPTTTASSQQSTTTTATATATTTTTTHEATNKDHVSELKHDLISKLRFRELHRELRARELPISGTTGQLRDRLRRAVSSVGTAAADECRVDETMNDQGECVPADLKSVVVDFVDESDPDLFEYNELMRDIETKAAAGHWKGAVRKLKRLTRKFGSDPDKYDVPAAVFEKTLEACMADRLHAARAAEPARKIIEQMAERGMAVDGAAVNHCIRNCLSDDPARLDSTHQGFGGLDTALAMLAAVSATTDGDEKNPPETAAAAVVPVIQLDTYDKIARALAKEGSIDDAIQILKALVVDRGETPALSTFAAVAMSAVGVSPTSRSGNNKKKATTAASAPAAATTTGKEDRVLTVLQYVKSAGYELDNVAATADGRRLLAAGLIAAERLDNTALGLRILTGAAKVTITTTAEDEDESQQEQDGAAAAADARTGGDDGNDDGERGDALVASGQGAAAQRAATLLHKRAIDKAVDAGQWKLAVRLVEYMLERKLKPSSWIWKSVITCCAKNEKSRKATALLLDWVKLYETGKADHQPPLSAFNTCMNCCEICDEQELTLIVLDAMKRTHDTEGNIITFNIALKRLAKKGNADACEGIIVGMLRAGVEPSVVSYTTAVAAAANRDNKRPEVAYEWLKRMRSRAVDPNTITYNTALAACLDGKLSSTELGSKMAWEMLADVERQLLDGERQLLKGDDSSSKKRGRRPGSVALRETDEYANVLPSGQTKFLVQKLMKQLKDNWVAGDIEKSVAVKTIRIPLLRLVDFEKSEAAQRYRELKAAAAAAGLSVDSDDGVEYQEEQRGDDDEDSDSSSEATLESEVELEYSAVHRSAQV